MRGTILLYENKQGIIRGVDQKHYDFSSSNWLGATMPVVGQTIEFMPDGTNASNIYTQEPVTGSISGQSPETESDDRSDRPPAGRFIYNTPGAVAATLLLLSLIPVYGQLSYKTYSLTGSGLGGLYYVVALVLIGWVAYGGPWMGAVGLVVASLLCTVLALLSKSSLFSELSQMKRAVTQQTDALGQLGFGQAMQQATPGLADALTPGFYLHVLALLALIYLIMIHHYTTRSEPFTLPTMAGPPTPAKPVTGYRQSVTPTVPIQTTDVSPMNRQYTPTESPMPDEEGPFRSSLTVPIPSGEQTRTFFQNFLTFDRMIAPTLITIVYYIGLASCVLGGAFFLLSGLFDNGYGNEGKVTYGLSLLIVGPLMIRLWAEFFIVIFNIHTRLKNLDDKTPQA